MHVDCIKLNLFVVMDEATANIDVQTDSLIQTAIRKDFCYCSILTIAHRLNTVIDYDKILVLDKGSIAEFDEPHVLLTRPGSQLSFMVDETGPQNAALLRGMAKARYEEKRKQ